MRLAPTDVKLKNGHGAVRLAAPRCGKAPGAAEHFQRHRAYGGSKGGKVLQRMAPILLAHAKAWRSVRLGSSVS